MSPVGDFHSFKGSAVMKQLFITSVRDHEKGINGTVEIKDVPLPEPEADEIRIKVEYCSICGSDTHILTGQLGDMRAMTESMLPMAFGHELSGIIDKAGAKAQAMGFKEGDKVVPNYARYCYSCDMCRSGRENLCKNVRFDMNGFAQYAVYHMTQVHKIPEKYDLEAAALIEPLTIAIGAAEMAKISYGKTVAIMGAGGIGLMLVELARLGGASTITVFDLVEEKRALALKMGADYAFDPCDVGVLENAVDIAGGDGYDCVLEGTGAMSAAEMALKLLAPDGDGVYFAMYGDDPILGVNVHSEFYWNQKHLHGLKMGTGLFPKSIRMAGRMNLAALIQKSYKLDDYKQAFDDLFSKKFAKIVIKMAD
jgi:threonine dehydrogenase-like Zn-dependent dehydrogenase